MNDTPIDLEAYLRRIGFDGAPTPTLDVLGRLIERHASTIPFENIDVLAKRVPSLDLAALQRKLVQHRRGGYCFEQGSLFGAALRQAGFIVHGLEARVRAGVPADRITGRTHMALRVTLDNVDYLVDVGFGGQAPLAPLKLGMAGPQAAAGSVYRLADADGGSLLQLETHDGWIDCYLLARTEPQRIDYELANWYVATHPQAMLGNNLLTGRVVPGGRLTLFNRQLTMRPHGSGKADEKTVQSRAELADVLADGFGLDIDAADLDSLMGVIERSSADGWPR